MKKEDIFIKAAGDGDIKLVKELMQQANSSKKEIAFIEACRFEHVDLVKIFIENNINVKAKNNLALKWAAQNGNFELFKYLIEKGADIHDNKSIQNYNFFYKIFNSINIFKRPLFNDFFCKKTPLEIIISELKQIEIEDYYLKKQGETDFDPNYSNGYKQIIYYIYEQYNDAQKLEAKEMIKKLNYPDLNIWLNFKKLFTDLRTNNKQSNKIKI